MKAYSNVLGQGPEEGRKNGENGVSEGVKERERERERERETREKERGQEKESERGWDILRALDGIHPREDLLLAARPEVASPLERAGGRKTEREKLRNREREKERDRQRGREERETDRNVQRGRYMDRNIEIYGYTDTKSGDLLRAFDGIHPREDLLLAVRPEVVRPFPLVHLMHGWCQ